MSAGDLPAGFDPVLERLRREAARLRAEVYPGDLWADVQARRAHRAARPPRRAAKALLAAAAVLVLALLVLEREARRPDPPGLRTVTLSAFAAPAPPSMALPPLSLPPAPSIGQALSAGAGALSKLHPPPSGGHSQEAR